MQKFKVGDNVKLIGCFVFSRSEKPCLCKNCKPHSEGVGCKTTKRYGIIISMNQERDDNSKAYWLYRIKSKAPIFHGDISLELDCDEQILVPYYDKFDQHKRRLLERVH